MECVTTSPAPDRNFTLRGKVSKSLCHANTRQENWGLCPGQPPAQAHVPWDSFSSFPMSFAKLGLSVLILQEPRASRLLPPLPHGGFRVPPGPPSPAHTPAPLRTATDPSLPGSTCMQGTGCRNWPECDHTLEVSPGGCFCARDWPSPDSLHEIPQSIPLCDRARTLHQAPASV